MSNFGSVVERLSRWRSIRLSDRLFMKTTCGETIIYCWCLPRVGVHAVSHVSSMLGSAIDTHHSQIIIPINDKHVRQVWCGEKPLHLYK